MDRPVFLKRISRKGTEEFEVSEEAVNCYKNKYLCYKKDWEPTKYRMLMSMAYSEGKKGFCLCKTGDDNDPNNDSIDLAGDILIGKSSVCYSNSDIYSIFKDLYYTHGNCIPWPEGGNKGGSNDSYSAKLNQIKGIFENPSPDNVIRDVRPIIIESRKGKDSIGKRFPKKCIEYWIVTEWIQQNKTWKDFVRAHFLMDYVDADDNPHKLPEDNYQSLLMIIKLIVQRGYRIENGFSGKWNEENAIEVRQAFKAVELPEDEDVSPDKNNLKYSIIGEWE